MIKSEKKGEMGKINNNAPKKLDEASYYRL